MGQRKVIKPIDTVTDAMSAGLNAIDEHERLMRVDVVRATFEDKCMVAGIENPHSLTNTMSTASRNILKQASMS